MLLAAPFRGDFEYQRSAAVSPPYVPPPAPHCGPLPRPACNRLILVPRPPTIPEGSARPAPPRTQHDASDGEHEQNEQDTPVGTNSRDRRNPTRLDGFAPASEEFVATLGRTDISVITQQIVRNMDDEIVRLVTTVLCAQDAIVDHRCGPALTPETRVTAFDAIAEQTVVADQRATREACACAIARVGLAASVTVVASTSQRLERTEDRATIAA